MQNMTKKQFQISLPEVYESSYFLSEKKDYFQQCLILRTQRYFKDIFQNRSILALELMLQNSAC